MNVSTVNLEEGMPTVEAAKNKFNQALRTARASGVKVVKIIHGYGSSGRGGAIKQEIARQMLLKKRLGQIKDYVSGEDFSPFNEAARNILSACPELSRDRDYSRCNHGISLILL